MNAPLIVTAASTGRFAFKCECCLLHKPKARCAKGRKAERRTLKRRERQEFHADLRSGALDG
jgi:hypothetical protein